MFYLHIFVAGSNFLLIQNKVYVATTSKLDIKGQSKFLKKNIKPKTYFVRTNIANKIIC